jgi:hypothetical protein
LTGEIASKWRRYTELRQRQTIERYRIELAQLGIPPTARTLDLTHQDTVLLSVFVGLVTGSKGSRLVVVDGHAATVHDRLSASMTSRLATFSTALLAGSGRIR